MEWKDVSNTKWCMTRYYYGHSSYKWIMVEYFNDITNKTLTVPATQVTKCDHKGNITEDYYRGMKLTMPQVHSSLLSYADIRNLEKVDKARRKAESKRKESKSKFDWFWVSLFSRGL